MRKLTAQLAEEYDYVLLDCPAGIEQGFQNAIAGATRAIVVTTPEVSAIRDADRIIGLLEKEKYTISDSLKASDENEDLFAYDWDTSKLKSIIK